MACWKSWAQSGSFESLANAAASSSSAPFWGSAGVSSVGKKGGQLALHIEGSRLANSVNGYFDLSLAEQIMRRADALVAAHGRIIVFSDWRGMTAYDSECRRQMTAWGAGLGAGLEAFHVIATSRLVQMGLSVAAILVPTLRVHDHVEKFLAAYEQ